MSFKFLIRILLAILFLVPLYWMVSAALFPTGSPLPHEFRLLPQEPTLSNFTRMWSLVPLGQFTLNSIVVVGIAVPLTLITGSWAGFAIAQLPVRSQRRWIVLSLALLMVPGISIWSTRFFVFRSLGWMDTNWALIAPAWMGTSPFYVLMFYRAFRRIPAALYEAARLDGAGVLRAWWTIALPLVRPTVIGVALLAFVLYWGDFSSPLLYIKSEQRYTLPIALQLLGQMDRSDFPLLMSAAVWATAVPVLIFILLQPYFSRMDKP